MISGESLIGQIKARVCDWAVEGKVGLGVLERRREEGEEFEEAEGRKEDKKRRGGRKMEQ